MSSVTIEEAESRLSEMIDQLKPGDSIVLTRGAIPVARLVAEEPPIRPRRKAGSAKGLLVIVQDDDEHLKDFAEHME